MKKTAFWCLLLICCSCIAFTGGYFLGRNANRTPVQVDKLPQVLVTDATAATDAAQPGKININTASAEELQTLPKIGQTLAQRIIDYRTAHGPFATLGDLSKVSGIGEGILEAILDKITVGG